VSAEAVQLVDARTATLMKVVPYEEFGNFPYDLNDVERLLIQTASPAEWDQARRWIASERFLIDCEFRTLGELLLVAARYPGRVPVAARLTPPTPVAQASRWARLRRWVRRRRRASTGTTVAAEAIRWDLPAEDFGAAVLALARLGWIEAA
jgi:hypothetical protein